MSYYTPYFTNAPADKQGGGLTDAEAGTLFRSTAAKLGADTMCSDKTAGAFARAVLARVAPSVPERWTIHQQTTGDWVLRNEGSGDGALCFHDDESPLAEVVRQLCQSLAAAPLPEHVAPSMAQAGLSVRCTLCDGRGLNNTVDGVQPCWICDGTGKPAEQPAEEARGAMKGHEIAATVNDLRDIAVQYRDAQQLRARIASLIVPILRAANAHIRDLEADRDSWRDQAEDRLKEWDRMRQRAEAAEQRIREVCAAIENWLNLRERIQKAGRPPHTDYWHQSIDDAHDRLRAAIRAEIKGKA